jgi:mannosylglycerate hydrolase
VTTDASRRVVADPPPTPGEAGPAIIHLVPHTHWDREWYEPFQVFRMRLVELVDQLLDSMEADERLAFTLDGQVATIDDYLEIRPAARTRIERLIREGRLAIGPWQILMDEFLVSGETLIRNLELGWHAAEALGGAMRVGYLPDMFGHVAQMPQLLRRAGIGHAVVWRGVPAAIDRHAFTWRSPDGSTVRTEYLVGGYGNGAYLLAIPERLAEKVGRYADASRSFYGDRSILAMYGTDHAVPSPRLASIVAEANEARTDIEVRIETLTEYIRAFEQVVEDPALPDPAPAPEWTGELRSAARANMLMNVTSARIDIKIAAGRAERILERYAEPLAALHGAEWPERLLELAWRRVIDNSAHDSICGCSHDAVVDQVLTRFAEADQIGRGVAAAAVRGLGAGAQPGAAVVVNPSPFDRTDVVELELEVPAAWDAVELELADRRRVPTQLLDRPGTELRRLRILGAEIPDLFVRRLHGRELFGHSLDGLLVESDAAGHRLFLLVDDPNAAPNVDVDAIRDAAAVAAADALDAPWDVIVVCGDRRRLAAAIPAPPLTSMNATAREGAATTERGDADAVVVDGRRASNGLVSVDVSDDGTYTITGGGLTLVRVGRIVDGGDFGDTYNYGPPAADDLVDAPTAVRIATREVGPLRGALDVIARYEWPVGVMPNGAARTRETASVDVTTTLELRIGEPFLRVAVAFVNPARDHRVRWHLPLAEPTDRSAAEGQFAVVERGLTAEAGHGEVPTPTFPAHGFVHVAGATILLDHVTEYELVDGRELALTVLRSTGLISRNENPFREDPAGPEVPVPGAWMLGSWRFAFGVLPHAGTWATADASRVAEQYQLPFVVASGAVRGPAEGAQIPPKEPATSDLERGPGGATTAATAESSAGLRIEGDGVVLTALRRRGDELELRVVARIDRPTVAIVSGRAILAARDVDLLGRPGTVHQPAPDGSLRLELGAWEIRTVRLQDQPAPG